MFHNFFLHRVIYYIEMIWSLRKENRYYHLDKANLKTNINIAKWQKAKNVYTK